MSSRIQSITISGGFGKVKFKIYGGIKGDMTYLHTNFYWGKHVLVES
jgi:hypothetical protein